MDSKCVLHFLLPFASDRLTVQILSLIHILTLAKEINVNFVFEASVGGGIPIIRPMHLCLAANRIDEVYGILNGTTNFILTKMIKELSLIHIFLPLF